MSIHINTPKGADSATALVNHCLRTANAKGLHADVLLSVGTSLAAELASQAPEARTAIALHLRNVADKIDGGCFDQIGQFDDYEAVAPQAMH